MSRRLDEVVVIDGSQCLSQKCIKCSVELTNLNRHPSHAKANVRRCKDCHKSITKAWAREHPEVVKAGARRRHKSRTRAYSPEQKRDYYLRKNYGITREQFVAMLCEQGYKCANRGCRTSEPKAGLWHLDHCHVSGRIRGVLCGECNRMLGAARDSISVLLGGADYLRRSEAGDVAKVG